MAVSSNKHVYILSSKLHSAAEFCIENMVVFPFFGIVVGLAVQMQDFVFFDFIFLPDLTLRPDMLL